MRLTLQLGILLLLTELCFSQVQVDKNDSSTYYTLKNLIEHTEDQFISDPMEAVNSATEIIEQSRLEKYTEFEAEGHHLLGNAYAELSMYDKSLMHTHKALKLYQEMDNATKIVKLTNNIGNLYWHNENYTKAYEFYAKAHQLAVNNKLDNNIPPTLMNLGLALSKMGQIDSALFYYRKSLKLVEQENDIYGTGIISNNIGAVFYRNRQLDSAISYYHKARINRVPLQTQIQSLIFSNLTKAYVLKNELRNAEIYLDSANFLSAESRSYTALKGYHNAKFMVDSVKGDFNSAILSYQTFTAYKDSVYNERFTNKLAHFQSVYDLDEKEKQLKLISKKEADTRKKVHTQRIIILSSIVVLIIISILSFHLFYYLRLNRMYKNSFKEKNKRLASKNTTLLKREKELLDLNDSKNKLFSIIAHDIKSPLYSMIRLADLLIDKYDNHDDIKRKNYLGLLNDTGKELANMIENLLSWSRYQIGNIPFRPNYFPVIEAFNFTLGISKHLANQKQIEIVINVPEHTLVFGDFSMISTVIRNMLTNAIKYTPDKGRIEVNLQDSLDYVKINIIDNGIGMDAGLIQKIFSVEEKTSRKGTAGEKGTGLGLALCKEFVEKNGGQIGVKSKVNEGSTFWFTLKKQQE